MVDQQPHGGQLPAPGCVHHMDQLAARLPAWQDVEELAGENSPSTNMRDNCTTPTPASAASRRVSVARVTRRG